MSKSLPPPAMEVSTHAPRITMLKVMLVVSDTQSYVIKTSSFRSPGSFSKTSISTFLAVLDVMQVLVSDITTIDGGAGGY